MADTGLVNLSLRLEDINDFIDSFKDLGQTVKDITDQVSNGMIDISKYLKQCADSFTDLDKSLKTINSNLANFKFADLEKQLKQFEQFSNVLAQTTQNSANLQQQTITLNASLSDQTVIEQTKELKDALNSLQIPQSFIQQTKTLADVINNAINNSLTALLKKFDEVIDLLKNINVNTMATSNGVNNLNTSFSNLSKQLSSSSQAFSNTNAQMGQTQSWISRMTSGLANMLFFWRKNTQAQQQMQNQQNAGGNNNTASQTQGVMGMFNNKTIKEGLNYIKWTTKRIVYFGAINGFIDAFKNIPAVTKQYEKAISGLSVGFGGDITLAKEQFKELNDAINHIPQSMDEVISVSKTLANFKFNTTKSDIISLAKIAEGTGESFEGLADAMGKFAKGNINSLKRFGIDATGEGDKIALTFKGVTTEIKKDTESLQKYLNNLANTEFATALDEQMNGLTGSYKRLGNAWDDLSLALSQSGIKDFLKTLTDQGAEYIQRLIKWLKDPEIQVAVKTVCDGILSIWEGLKESVSLSWTILKNTVTVVGTAITSTIGGISRAVTVFSDNFKYQFDDQVNKIQMWADICIATINTVARALNEFNKWFSGDLLQKQMNLQTNIVTKQIIQGKNFKELKSALIKEYGENFENETFFFGDQTVIQNYSQKVNESIAETEESLKRLYETGGDKRAIKYFQDGLKQLKTVQKQLVEVTRDSRYMANQKSFDYDNTYKGLETEIEKVINNRKKAEEEARKKNIKSIADRIKFLWEGQNKKGTKITTKDGDSGSGGHAKELKEWSDFYNDMLAKVTTYGKERINITKTYTDNLKNLEKNYQEDTNVSFEEYQSLKLAIEQKYQKDMEDMIKTQSENIQRLFNGSYKNQLLDLDKALKERNDKIQNALANGAITQNEANQYLLQSEQKFNEDKRLLESKAQLENTKLIDNQHAIEVATLQQQYDEKLKLLKEYLNDQRISYEEYAQGELRARQELADKKRQLEENDFNASAGVISSAMSSFQKLDETLKKYDLSFNEVLGNLSDKGKLTSKANALMWADMSNGMSNYFGFLTQNFEKGSGVYNSMFALQKGFAIASATISMIQGAMEAWKLGFPAGIMAGMSVLAQGASLIGQLKSVQFRAKGGRLDPSALTVVGEQGPELISGLSGNVVSNPKSKDLLNNLGNNNNVTVNLIEDSSRAGQVNQRNSETDKQMIIDVIVSNIRGGGDVANAMSGTYGLARQGY